MKSGPYHPRTPLDYKSMDNPSIDIQYMPQGFDDIKLQSVR